MMQWTAAHSTTHRIAWMAKNGAIPAGMLVCHKCDNPLRGRREVV